MGKKHACRDKKGIAVQGQSSQTRVWRVGGGGDAVTCSFKGALGGGWGEGGRSNSVHLVAQACGKKKRNA